MAKKSDKPAEKSAAKKPAPAKAAPQKTAAKAQPAALAQRRIGVVVPVGALRGKEQAAVGEYLDLAEFAGLCKDWGVGLIQILPVNDTGYESSPYSALTAFALHPLYIRISALPEAKPFAAKIAELGKTFGGDARFPYYKVLSAKMEILREIYAANEAAIAKDAALAKWIDGHSWVKPYAVFRRLKEANGEKSWQEWSPAAKSGKTPENIPAEIDRLWNDAKLRGEHLFWAWLQKALDEQFLEAAKAVRDAGILLEGDLPILMNEDSCDVWAHRGIFRMDLSAGAPPDMYSPAGQNWGFPIYHWDEQAKDNYAWWRARLAAASSYYDCYRIDHVLGFFRIWASSRADNSSALGRFVPYLPITTKDLAALGFDKNRIRWLSRPHLPTGEVWDGIRAASIPEHEVADAANKSFELALDRIGGEELWLFKDKIKGEKDIEALGLPPAAVSYLTLAWHNRLFYEYESGKFFPVWYFRDSRAYNSLSQEEKDEVEALVEKRRVDSEKIWEKEGQKLLSVLIDSSHMLPCAEDLGAVPDCVPKVLAKLKILGLRVVRWHRLWDEEGQPYIPFNNYPELSVCTPSVHDSSTLREWWDTEADQEHFSAFLGVPSLPKVYNPGTAKIILKHCAAAASRFRVFQIQDVLNLSQKWYGGKAQDDRINVPGTANEFNWTYRLPASIETIKSDAALAQEVKELGA